MTIKTFTRRAIGPLAILAGFAGCNRMVWGTSHSYLPEAFGHPRVIFDSGLGNYFYIYELSKSTKARIVAEGTAFEGFHARPRSRNSLHDFAAGVRWFDTPMFTGPAEDRSRRVRPDAQQFLGKWAERLEGYYARTKGHHLSNAAQRAYDVLRDSLEQPGNYFGFDHTSEAFGIVDVRHSLMLLARGET